MAVNLKIKISRNVVSLVEPYKTYFRYNFLPNKDDHQRYTQFYIGYWTNFTKTSSSGKLLIDVQPDFCQTAVRWSCIIRWCSHWTLQTHWSHCCFVKQTRKPYVKEGLDFNENSIWFAGKFFQQKAEFILFSQPWHINRFKGTKQNGVDTVNIRVQFIYKRIVWFLYTYIGIHQIFTSL